MIKKLIGTIVAVWMLFAGVAMAQNPVVVELYTSQGCSSCPPADALLQEYAERDDVIALALHVDYWDYIGWDDTFAQAQFTERQRAYARAAGKRMVYTPQMIIGGKTHIAGFEPAAVEQAVQAQSEQPGRVELSIERTGSRVRISASANHAEPMIVQILRYVPLAEVSIRRGENAGRNMQYSHIVTSLEELRRWNGRSALNFTAPAPGNAPVVVLIQHVGHGPVLAAARLR